MTVRPLPEPAVEFAPYEDDGLLFACRLDGEGGAATCGWAELDAMDATTDRTGEGSDAAWVHLRRDSERARNWLNARPWLDALTVDALLAESTRPRIVETGRGIVAILRGINHEAQDAGAPSEFLSLRLYCDGTHLVSIRKRRLQTPHDILEQLLSPRRGPRDVTSVFERLVSRITERMSTAVLAFDERLDDVEASVDAERPGAGDARRELSALRRRIVETRRYVYPQREALTSLLLDPPDWMPKRGLSALRETNDRLLRYVEELDAARERALVIRDDIQNRLSERTNRILFALSILSAVFLPLTFVTGALGMNVGGLPGIDSGLGFAVSCAVMLVVTAAELAVLWRLGWIRPPRRAGRR